MKQTTMAGIPNTFWPRFAPAGVDVGRLSALPPTLLARTLLHPRLKTPMRLLDHLYFVAEHDDHHLRRIHELLDEAAFHLPPVER